MGLDFVEIVMEVEDSFGVTLPDDEVAEIATPGDLCDFVIRRLWYRDAHPCLSANVFFRLRRAFIETLGIDRAEFHPDTTVTNLLPLRHRKRLWNEIARYAGLRLPPLRRSAWISNGASVLFLVLLPVTGVLAAIRHAIAMPAVALECAALIVVCGFQSLLTSPFAVCVPKGCKTVTGAVRTTVQRNYRRVEVGSAVWEEEQVWARLQEILADTLGVETADITREAHLVRDLGCG